MQARFSLGDERDACRAFWGVRDKPGICRGTTHECLLLPTPAVRMGEDVDDVILHGFPQLVAMRLGNIVLCASVEVAREVGEDVDYGFVWGKWGDGDSPGVEGGALRGAEVEFEPEVAVSVGMAERGEDIPVRFEPSTVFGINFNAFLECVCTNTHGDALRVVVDHSRNLGVASSSFLTGISTRISAIGIGRVKRYVPGQRPNFWDFARVEDTSEAL